MRILVEIPTKDRDQVLGRCICALLQQSYEDFDVLILNDGDRSVGDNPSTEYALLALAKNRTVWVEDGSKISQAHNHNIPLYDSRFSMYDWIIRLDDDVLLNKYAIEYMVDTADNSDAMCIGGLWFENEWSSEQYHDRAMISWEPSDELETAGRVGDLNSNWQQRMYRTTDDLQQVEHIYSVCMYNADAMRYVGGWPEVYSKGVAHGEETDGTYRLHLAGFPLVIDPRVTGNHLKSSGGIRSTDHFSHLQMVDNAKWQNRRPKLEKIKQFPTVAIWCQHAHGIGGAQRLFYQTINLLQSKTGLIVYPIFTASHFSPDECEQVFGFRYTEKEPLDEYDICIVMGHEPHHPVKAKQYILYTFFPDDTTCPFDDYSLILGISKYSSDYIASKWGYKAKYVYPCVTPVDTWVSFGGPNSTQYKLPSKDKENIVLMVSRADPNKAPLLLMKWFVEMNLDGWKMHYVCASTDLFAEYEEQIRYYVSENSDKLEIHFNVSNDELDDLYRRSKILWHGRGLYSEHTPNEAEHFGLVPLEAWSAGCIPMPYNSGGPTETIHEDLRWSSKDELIGKTKLISAFGLAKDVVPADLSLFSEDKYARDLYYWIRRVNGLAVELDKIGSISVTPKKIRVAAIADSPLLTTGFGVVADQIYRRMVADKDIELCVCGIMDNTPPEPFAELPYALWNVDSGDLQARRSLPMFIKWAEPDVVWELYDPGNLAGHIMSMKALGQKLPWVGYFPVEGGRVNKEAYAASQLLDYSVTYCHNAANALRRVIGDEIEIYVGYHGADHADFKPLDPDRRERIRELVGWSGKYVIMNVGTNKRVKQQPYLIEALRILLDRGYDDVYLYLHTREYDDNVMQGWDLGWIAKHDDIIYDLGVRDHLLFPMQFANKWKGTPWTFNEDLDYDRLTMPPTPQGRGAIFNGIDFITRYAIADMYVDVSSAEGWGLPPLEAAACGVPTISVDDGMARSEVHSKYCHMIKPVHWTTWHTGATLALVDPRDVADAIIEVREMGIRKPNTILEDLPWEPTAQLMIDLIKKAYRD